MLPTKAYIHNSLLDSFEAIQILLVFFVHLKTSQHRQWRWHNSRIWECIKNRPRLFKRWSTFFRGWNQCLNVCNFGLPRSEKWSDQPVLFCFFFVQKRGRNNKYVWSVLGMFESGGQGDPLGVKDADVSFGSILYGKKTLKNIEKNVKLNFCT